MANGTGATTARDPGPLSWEVERIFGPCELDCLDGPEARAYGDAMYGDFPHGADLRVAVEGGYGLDALQEADMRVQAWTLLRDQAVVTGLLLGRFTYREVGLNLGISTAAAHKRYAQYVRPELSSDPGMAGPP